MNKVKYILLTYSNGKESIKKFEFEQFPEELVKKFTGMDLQTNQEREKGSIGWALYRLDGKYYIFTDGETINEEIKQEMEDFIDSKVNKFFYSETSKLRDILTMWNNYLEGKIGKERIKSFAENILLQANKEGVYRATATEKGHIALTDSSFVDFEIYDTGKTEEELYVAVAVTANGITVGSQEQVSVMATFSVYQPLYKKGALIEIVNEVESWYADVHNMEIVVL